MISACLLLLIVVGGGVDDGIGRSLHPNPELSLCAVSFGCCWRGEQGRGGDGGGKDGSNIAIIRQGVHIALG